MWFEGCNRVRPILQALDTTDNGMILSGTPHTSLLGYVHLHYSITGKYVLHLTVICGQIADDACPTVSFSGRFYIDFVPGYLPL